MTTKSIWIYSDEQVSPVLSILRGQENGYIKVTNFSKIEELIHRLDRDKSDLIIIDNQVDMISRSLVDLLTFCASSKVPVLFHELKNGQEIRLDEILPYNSPKPGKLVLRRIQSEHIENDKSNLDIVNQTAATLGHEINNPLMAITANIEMILNSDESLPERIEQKIRQIDKAARRIRLVTDNLINLDNLKFRETAAGRMIQFEEKGEEEEYSEPELVDCAVE